MLFIVQFTYKVYNNSSTADMNNNVLYIKFRNKLYTVEIFQM